MTNAEINSGPSTILLSTVPVTRLEALDAVPHLVDLRHYYILAAQLS
jgi:hypothetical protein